MYRFGVATSAMLCLLALTLGCAPMPTTPPGPPRVTVDPETRQLGVVGLGEDAVAEFLVRNDGRSPLTLAARRLPRATRVEGLVPALAPGQAVTVRFRIDTLEGDGNRLQEWDLVTNDAERPQVTLRTELDVRPFLVARPGYARYITVQHEREGTITQTVGAVDGAAFAVLRVESPTPALRVSFREATPDERNAAWTGSQWRVMTTLASDAPVGVVTGEVVIHTDHPRQKRVFIPLSGFVRPIVAVTPPDARIGDVDRRQAEAIQLFVKNFAEKAIEVSGVSTDVASLRAEVQPIEPGRSWWLKLFPVPDAPLGPFEGKILLRTASPHVPRVEIPVSGRLVESAGSR